MAHRDGVACLFPEIRNIRNTRNMPSQRVAVAGRRCASTPLDRNANSARRFGNLDTAQKD